jgi:uncharacterized protein
MQVSKFNIVSKLKNSSEFFIVNLLSGNADIISPEEVKFLEDNLHQAPKEFFVKGYLVNPAEELMQYRLKYIDFIEKREQEEVQVFFVPTYLCNFSCSYCYQSEYPVSPVELNPQIIEAFFNFLNTKLKDRKKYITLFGGEPFLSGKTYKDSLASFFELCTANDLELAVVTNGYNLDEYLELLSGVSVREIQVTLDGLQEVHNQRRPLKGGLPSFTRIIENIDRCLAMGFTVNLRVVADRQNMHELPALARFAIEKGWTKKPNFKTQLGRNYELHYCQSAQSKLFSRVELYQELYHLINNNPEILEFHKPAFSISKFLAENGTLPEPLFDSCPACKSEWALDYSGKVFSCTATVGKPGEELGTFYPEIKLDESTISAWQERDTLHIEKCASCNLQLACGGGCGSVAKNQHGALLTPDCRPVKELLELGIDLYFRD